jgi:SAM-dependent methyltransferase
MLGKARRNAEQYRDQSGLDNIEFRLGEIEHLPLPDNSVDCVISNCVINLSPDKPQVWREVFRVLKPGGRVAISDMALLKDLPPDIRELAEALVGCVAGAVKVAETEAMAREAGFKHVACETHGEYVEAMKGHKGGLYDRIEAALPEGEQPSDYIVSLLVTGRKPKPGCCCEA